MEEIAANGSGALARKNEQFKKKLVKEKINNFNENWVKQQPH